MKTTESKMQIVMNNIIEFTDNACPQPVYTDDWIERCAETYQNLRIANYGVTFETFVAYPRQVLRQIQQARSLLESSSTLVQEANDRIHKKYDQEQTPAIRCCGSQLMQPMHHRQTLSKRKTGHVH